MCAGTRGDVQPFVALGLQLQVTVLHMTLFLFPCRHLHISCRALSAHLFTLQFEVC